MIEALSGCHPSWEGANLEEITVKDVSGFGGNRTYKITRTCKNNKDILSEVAFHVVGKNNNSMNQPGILEVQTLATIAFGNADIYGLNHAFCFCKYTPIYNV